MSRTRVITRWLQALVQQYLLHMFIEAVFPKKIEPRGQQLQKLYDYFNVFKQVKTQTIDVFTLHASIS